MHKSWEDTELWQALKQRNDPDAESVRATIQSVMPNIETILNKSATSPLDFTLHDADHSFRVASTIHRLMTADTETALSVFELALLLLSAYLHDIGMAPHYGRVAAVRNYFLAGHADGLEASEAAEIERWLSDSGQDIAAVRNAETPIAERNALGAELTTHYCRHRHNDWSSEWIRHNLSGKALSSYAGWVDDLTALCASHHHGHDRLKEDRFNPHLVSSPARRVHPRYLACLLRLADVLEFDPERVPTVILQQRNVSEGSLIYWWKDAEISADVRPDSIIVSARPPSAQIQYAIYDTCDQVDRELQLCRQLDNETHFVQVPGGAEEAFRWRAPSAVSRDVSPRNNAYVYINGAFRPDTKKLLHLLSGIELYGNPLAAVRELLQNAFDAVREQIAYERLSKEDPANPEYEAQIANLHRVDLRVDADEHGATLTCTDDGIGMNVKIIENHFLVSGSPSRRDIAELEKRCNEHGFSTERTGKFGIGVLSYFMIGDSVKVETIRGNFPRDSDGTGWTFETAGIGSFGQLTTNRDIAQGSRVTIRLRRQIHTDLRAWCERLHNYLDAELLRLPCRLHFSSPSAEKVQWPPGWCALTLPQPWYHESLDLPREVMPSETATRLKEAGSNLDRLMRDARACVSWQENLGVLWDDAGQHIGRYRIAVPTFTTPAGRSVAYFDVKTSSPIISLNPVGPFTNAGWAEDGFKPKFTIRLAWKGMLTRSSRMHEDFAAAVHVDLASDTAGSLSVSRNEFRLVAAAMKSILAVTERIPGLIAEATSEGTTPFSLVDSVYSKVLPDTRSPIYWLKKRRSSTTMEPMRFPAIEDAEHLSFQGSRLFWRNERLNVCQSISLTFPADSTLSESALEPTVMGLLRGGPYPIYTQARERRELPRCQFPPAWSDVIGSHRGLNEAHPIVRNTTAAGREWVRNTLENFNPVPFADEILRSPARAASWIYLVLSNYTRSSENPYLWRGLCERHSLLIQDLWHTALGQNVSDHAYWHTSDLAEELIVLSPAGWERGAWREYLPDPGPDWTITEAPARRRKAAGKAKP